MFIVYWIGDYMVNMNGLMNICKSNIIKVFENIFLVCKVFDYITFGLSRIGKSENMVRPMEGLTYFIFVNTLLRKQEVLKYMGEVMICRGGGIKGGYNEIMGSVKFKSELITENTIWTVPDNIVNNEVDVRIFGGGGGGVWAKQDYMGYGGGGGGWMNNDILTLISGMQIQIVIGNGGIGNNLGNLAYSIYGGTGGTTSFGEYLSANGGTGGHGSDSGSSGGNGGSGGGAWYSGGYSTGNGGIGYQFGGGASLHSNWKKSSQAGNGGVWGGGAGGHNAPSNGYGYGNGGNGGIYGGGGGSPGYYSGDNSGKGGTYGGDAGNNGTNTSGWTNTEFDLINNIYVTGWGICQNPGNDMFGGGGFGGNGGAKAGSGGGGYGGNGGDGWFGGGGGYGRGADGGTTGGGGGGYYRKGGDNGGGGGGYYSGYGDGGGGSKANSGNSGVCILRYYIRE